MKRYYRNWYQHYLELQAEKEREIQRGYYSNLAPKTEKNPETVGQNKSTDAMSDGSVPPVEKSKKAKQKFRLLDLFFPFVTVCAFVFIWYQLDVGPIRHVVNEGFVLIGVREEAVNVISYHVNLLDQHLEFADAVAQFISGETELSFADLDLLYHQIRARHSEMIDVSMPVHAEAVRLWGFKVASTHQMMNGLLDGGDVTAVHAQFLSDQAAIAAMIRSELAISD